ncbi:MAG: chloride channel protein [Bacteroidaceae bacterium]|nr:chloride channel protein [Bacteroidaceae bacterium]
MNVTTIKEKISEKRLVMVLSLFVGFFAAVAGYVLHWIIHRVQLLLTQNFDPNTFNWLYMIYPAIGILVTALFVRYVVRDNISHGITRILYAISRSKSRLKAHNCWSSVVASAITIGCGGSVGAEAPIVLTGSAIGSNLGRMFGLDNKTLMVLVGCGASAAIAGVFKAPMAGLVFTLEVLMIDLTMASLLPILIASVTATCFTYIFMGSDSLFHFTLDADWTVRRVPATLLLGAFCGIVSLYFMRTMAFTEGIFSKLKEHFYLKWIVGALILSTLIILFPSLYGEGYNSINILLNGTSQADWDKILDTSVFAGKSNLLVLYVAMVVLTKVFATSATNGGGGCGGTFAPSLFIGAFAGFLFARIWNIYDIGVELPEKNFALLGMAAVMAGVMHAPLTGIFLIAEITGGYNMFIPLMIVAISSYLTINIFEPHSIYAGRLAREGKLLTHHTDQAVLTLMNIQNVIDKNNDSVKPDVELGQLVKYLSRSKRNVLPVLDDAGHLLGEIDMMKLRHIVFRTELYHHFTVRQLMSQPAAIIGINDPMESVMKLLDETHAHQLPVCETDGTLIGYISRYHVYRVYRQMVYDLSQE